jgi:hypothetical protein
VKTKAWILCLAALLVLCAAISAWVLWPGEQALWAEVWSDGELVETVSLMVDRELRVQSAGGVNVLTVQNGKIAVTHADCPDGYCMDRGYCDRGTDIVCLPNRLVIRFVAKQEVDGVVK